MFVRAALMGLLGLGAIGGFASGFASLRHGGCHAGWRADREFVVPPAPPVVVNAAPAAAPAATTLVIPIVIGGQPQPAGSVIQVMPGAVQPVAVQPVVATPAPVAPAAAP